MNLHVSPDAPPLVQAATAAILVLHIGGGAVGMVAGAGALVFRKGGALHRAAGNVFVVAMLTMAGIGAAVAPFLPSEQWTNTLAGVMTCYLVVTGWRAGRRRDGQMGRFEIAAFPLALCGMAAAFTGAWLNAHAAQRVHGPTEMGLYVFGLICMIAAAGDLHLILRRGLSGPARLARHIWRMSVALTIATASFFLGQPRFVPAAIRDSFLVALPVIAPLALMVFWQVKVRWPRRRQPLNPSFAARTAPNAS
jgi:uncharacterized membrane protein